jgi:hypothetical protein
MSYLIQCYIYYNPKTLLILKKKSLLSEPRAREEQEYTFAKQQYTPFSPLS